MTFLSAGVNHITLQLGPPHAAKGTTGVRSFIPSEFPPKIIQLQHFYEKTAFSYRGQATAAPRQPKQTRGEKPRRQELPFHGLDKNTRGRAVH